MIKLIVYTTLLFCFGCLQGQVDFSADSTSGCGPLNVQFKDLSSGAIKWTWDLGNGNQSALQNPKAIYTTPGYYTVKLTITDNSGNSYTKQSVGFIHVYTPPNPYFIANKKRICPGDSVKFTNQSLPGDAPLVKYSWDFGDGNASNVQHPTHTFKTPAYRNISLLVTDQNGCFAIKKFTSYIQIWSPPTADFSLDSNLSCNLPTKVSFKSNVFPGGLQHQWDLGNGNTSTSTNPVETYTKFGRYHVKLTVVDANGCIGSKLVNDAVIIDKIALNFSVEKTQICDTSSPVKFLNTSNVYNGYTWIWSFGDAQNSNDFAPVHHYADFGIYNVTLQIKGPNCSVVLKKNNLVRVSPNPALSLRANDTGACGLPFTIKFHANTSGTAAVNWDFGDKSLGSGKFVTNTYDEDDTFKVFATAIEPNGCKTTDSIYVHTNSLLTIPVGETEGCVPFTLSLKSKVYETTAPVISEKWYYKNVEIANGNSVNYSFPNYGIYFVQYRAQNAKGCVDTPTYTIKVGNKSKPNFYAKKNNVCINEEVTFINTTSKLQTGLKFIWISSEGPRDTLRDFTTRFHTTQNYARITLIAINQGCKDTILKKDSTLVMFPKVDIKTPKLTCTLPDSIAIANRTTAYTQFRWSADPPSKSQTNDTMWLSSSNQQYKLKLFAKNDTTGCEDSFEFPISLLANAPFAGARYKLRDTCLPANALLLDSQSQGKEVFWQEKNDTNKIFGSSLPIYFSDYGIKTYHRIAINKSELQVCADTTTVQITIPKPDARFSVSPLQGCTPMQITLIDSGYFSGKKAFWKIGDSLLYSSGFNNTFTIKSVPASGKLPVVFTSFDSLLHCTESSAAELTVTGPEASIGHAFHYTCKNTRVDLSYTPISQVAITKVAWEVDDTVRSNNATYSHFVTKVKWLKAKLIITDANGCTSEIIKDIYTRVYKPQIKIGSDVKGAICPPVTVTFSDSTTNFNSGVETWLWNFGDGATSNIRNPIHTYATTGKYTVTLTVKNYVGCFATDSFPAYIDVKGPAGKIITGIDSGCVPWKVNFVTSAKDLKDVTWDFGDGSGANGVAVSHTFLNKGKFQPSAILEDHAGCKLGLVSDTILHGLESAIAKIEQTEFCENTRLAFVDKSYYAGQARKNEWFFAPWKSNGIQFQYIPPKGGKDTLHFIAFGPLGCNDTLQYNPRKSAIQLSVVPSDDTLCPGESVQFKNTSFSDTAFTNYTWSFNGIVSSDSMPIFNLYKPGFNAVTLTLQNAFNCSETQSFNDILIAGDTAATTSPELLVTSVLPDNTLEIRFRKSNAFDWKKYHIYDVTNAPEKIIKTATVMEDTMHAVALPNLLRQSYCIQLASENFCKAQSNWKSSAVHCQVNLDAKPDTNVVWLSWNPYAGNNVMETRLYRKQLPTGSEIYLLSPAIGNVAYIDSGVLCKTNYAYRMETIFSNRVWTSSSDTAQAEPIYKTELQPPYVGAISVENNRDLLLQVDAGAHSQKNVWNYLMEKSEDASTFTFYKQIAASPLLPVADTDVDPQKQAYHYRIAATDACGGQSAWSAVSNSIHLKSAIVANGAVQLQWNPYNYWPGGVLRYDIEIQDATGNFSVLATTSNTEYLVTGAGKHCGAIPTFRIHAYSNTNSGFIDSLTLQQSLSNTVTVDGRPEIYIPNAFTPNTDPHNPTFKPEVMWAKNYRLFIYDRWGAQIADVSGCNASWDGSYNGKPAPEGCYAYRLELTAANGIRSYHSGNILLLR